MVEKSRFTLGPIPREELLFEMFRSIQKEFILDIEVRSMVVSERSAIIIRRGIKTVLCATIILSKGEERWIGTAVKEQG